MATVSLAIAQTGKVRYNLTRRRPGARTGLRDNAQSRCQVGGPGSEGRPPPPAAARASLSPLPPLQPLCPPRRRPLPARRVCELSGGGLGGGSGRSWEDQGGQLSLGVGAAAHPQRSGSVTRAGTGAQPPPRSALVPPLWGEQALPAAWEPLATESSQHRGRARLSGWEGRGRAGAEPGRQQATPSVLLLLPRSRTSAPGACAPRLGNSAQELGKAGRQEREHCPGPEYSGSSPKAGKPRRPLSSPQSGAATLPYDCYILHRQQWLS